MKVKVIFRLKELCEMGIDQYFVKCVYVCVDTEIYAK